MFLPSAIVHKIIDFFQIEGATVELTTSIALAVTLVTSIVLSYIMIRYKGKRPVDIAVVLREVAFVLVLARVFAAVVWEEPLNVLALIIYVYLGFAVSALLILTIREQWFPPLLIAPTESKRLEECEIELQQLKEKSHGHEEV